VGLLNAHLDDAGFAEIWADRLTLDDTDASRPAERHLKACGECRARYAAFCSWLDTMRADAVAEADEAITADRLVSQQAQIARRLEGLEHPARVIAFPRFAHPVSARPSGRRRLIAAAAAAGLIAGVGLGQLMEFGSARRPAAESAPTQIARGNVSAASPARLTVQPVTAQISDESFLFDQDMAVSQPRVPESLQYLNAITPGARDYDPR
jgi:hypothetical protein